MRCLHLFFMQTLPSKVEDAKRIMIDLQMLAAMRMVGTMTKTNHNFIDVREALDDNLEDEHRILNQLKSHLPG